MVNKRKANGLSPSSGHGAPPPPPPSLDEEQSSIVPCSGPGIEFGQAHTVSLGALGKDQRIELGDETILCSYPDVTLMTGRRMSMSMPVRNARDRTAGATSVWT